jgi:hypothetical protein
VSQAEANGVLERLLEHRALLTRPRLIDSLIDRQIITGSREIEE